MSEEKSEAQLRNEAEVKRILEERGYSSTSSKKATEKALKNKGFSFKQFLVGFVAMAILIAGGGWAYFQFFTHKDHSEPEETTSIKHYYDDEDDADFIGFENCLNAVDESEVSLDDPEFWNKYIGRYESMISCYDQYPGIGSDFDKKKLEETLAEYRGYRDQASANEADYQAKMEQIEVERQKRLAEIEANAAAWDAELAERTKEREVESMRLQEEWAQQQAEYEKQQADAEAARLQKEQAAKERCDNYLATYGEKTAEELADADSEVVRAKYNWTQAQKKIRNCSGYSSMNQSEKCRAYQEEEQATADSLLNTYLNTRIDKISYYMHLRTEACNN